MNGLYVNFKFANFRDGLRQRGDQVFFLLKGLAKSTPKKKQTATTAWHDEYTAD